MAAKKTEKQKTSKGTSTKTGGYNQTKEQRKNFLDSAFDHLQTKKQKDRFGK